MLTAPVTNELDTASRIPPRNGNKHGKRSCGCIVVSYMFGIGEAHNGRLEPVSNVLARERFAAYFTARL